MHQAVRLCLAALLAASLAVGFGRFGTVFQELSNPTPVEGRLPDPFYVVGLEDGEPILVRLPSVPQGLTFYIPEARLSHIAQTLREQGVSLTLLDDRKRRGEQLVWLEVADGGEAVYCVYRATQSEARPERYGRFGTDDWRAALGGGALATLAAFGLSSLVTLPLLLWLGRRSGAPTSHEPG